MRNPVHHVELWTSGLARVEGSFDWLLTRLGWQMRADPAWTQGRTWHHEGGTYVVHEQSPGVSGVHDRMHAGLNHLALRASDCALLDALRAEACGHGWSELFAERYPHAGGSDHTALFLENAEGFEIEIVVD